MTAAPPLYRVVDRRRTGEVRLIGTYCDPGEAEAARKALVSAGDEAARVETVPARDPLAADHNA